MTGVPGLTCLPNLKSPARYPGPPANMPQAA